LQTRERNLTSATDPAGRTNRRGAVRVVVNADDFGRSPEVVAAVAQAYDEGILTSASLMVTGGAVAAAVQAARERPGLGVGLHLVLARARAASSPQEVPHMTDEVGLLPRSVTWAGLLYLFSPAARRELARELRAQFEAFAATGLSLSHVDSHHHLHLHPAVFPLVLSLAHEFGAGAIRLNVSDELLFSLRHELAHPWLKLGWKLVFSLLTFRCARTLRRRPLPTAARVYGLMQSGSFTARYLAALLEHLVQRRRPSAAAEVVEIYCHPSLRRESGALGPNPGDLAALLDPWVRSVAEQDGLLLMNFAEAFGPELQEKSEAWRNWPT